MDKNRIKYIVFAFVFIVIAILIFLICQYYNFEVVDIVCNMVINPHEVWVRLRSCDEDFTKRCGSKEFDAPEKQVLERMAA